MTHALTIRIGMAVSASLAIHLVVFAAAGPGGTATQITGGGAEIHIGAPPGARAASGAGSNQADPQPVSMHVPEPKTSEPKAPETEHETRPDPAPLPKPAPKPIRPELSQVAPQPPEPTPADTSAKPVEDTARAPAQETDIADDTAYTGTVPGPSVEAQAVTGAGSGTAGPAVGNDADAEDGVSDKNTVAGNASDQEGAGSGRAASTNYAGLVMQHLSKVRRPRASSPGSAFVSFTIGQDGELEDIRIAKSSRSSRFDRDALKVVRRAAPFPVPPPGVNCSFSVEIEGD
nr:TonB family protein [uncultured Hyphomonas sp.]